MSTGKGKSRKAKAINICIAACILAVAGYVLYIIVMYLTGIDAPLNKAAEKGDFAEVKRLVKAGEEIDKEDISGNTPLNEALLYDNYDVAEYLLSAGAKADDDSLFYVISGGNIDITKEIMALGVTAGKDSLAQYVYYNSGEEDWDARMINLLLKSGADIDAYFEGLEGDAYTALGYAVHERNTDLVEYLVGKGADVNAPMRNGTTPLQLAEQGYRKKLGGSTSDIRYYKDIPPSKTIAAYLKKHGAE